MHDILGCSIRALPTEWQVAAAADAVKANPANAPPLDKLALLLPEGVHPERLALLTTRYWGSRGVRLTVGFMESTADALAQRILSHMNAWGAFANVQFILDRYPESAQVRITREGDGYWSYLGTDILSVPSREPTMSLQDFTMKTPESEFKRVVRHEAGHTLGFPHEHLRADLVARLDPAKTLAYFAKTQGWSEQETKAQVLTPIPDSALIATAHADPTSIMCYQLPGTITRDGKPIAGGLDIDTMDDAFAAKVYPKVTLPTGGASAGKLRVSLIVDGESRSAQVESVSPV